MSKTKKGSDVDSSDKNTGVYPRAVVLAFVQYYWLQHTNDGVSGHVMVMVCVRWVVSVMKYCW